MKKALSLLLIITVLVCSCRADELDTSETSRDIKAYEPIIIETFIESDGSEIDFVDETELDETDDTVAFHIPEYEVIDCDFIVDKENHTIKAHYDDTSNNTDGYIVDIDLHYYDYGVQDISVYKTSKSYKMPAISLDNAVWKETLANYIGPIYTFESDEDRRLLSIESAFSFNLGPIRDEERLTEVFKAFAADYTLFPNFISYHFQIAEMNKYEDPDFSYGNFEDGYEMDLITLRTELDNLPVGLPRDNNHPLLRLYYGDYYGSFLHTSDEYYYDFSCESINTLIDFVYYPYDYELEYTAKVMPLEDCVSNALPGLIGEAYSVGGNSCYVYAAELVYVPFSVGVDRLGPYGNEILVPVWALYTVASSSNMTRANAVFLNAVTGELVSYGL